MRSFRILGLGLAVMSLGTVAAGKDPGPRSLDLENAIAQADLIITAQTTDVSERTVVYGGKAARSTQQFTFEPVQTLKGRFARATLKLTNDDLGTDQFNDRPTGLEKGQLRLLLLGRSSSGYTNSNRAATLELSVPLLSGRDDPLIATVLVLIRVTQEPDRGKKAEYLRDGLNAAQGRASIPLLHALGRRAILAAQTPNTMTSVARALGDDFAPTRETAAEITQLILEGDYLHQKSVRDEAHGALLAALERAGSTIVTRIALINALALAGDQARDAHAPWANTSAPKLSFAERTARFRAIGQLRLADRRDALVAELAALPVDAPTPLESAIEQSLILLASDQAARALTDRIEAKHAAGLEVHPELTQAAELPSARAATVLLAAARLPLDVQEQAALAAAAERVRDGRLVPVLAAMLNPRIGELRSQAITALLKIDTDETAQILRPHLSEEADLGRKLELAEFLGRHHIRDGYPYAIEHMSEYYLRDRAVSALAAIREPKAPVELEQILKNSNDPQWNAAAICALGRLGEKRHAEEFLKIAKNPHHPNCEAAIFALADLGDSRLVPVLGEAFSSRSDQIVITAARATGVLLSHADVHADALRDRLADLLADPEASQVARIVALESLVKLDDGRLDRALAIAVRDGRMEGSPLLAQVEQQLLSRKVALKNR